MVPSSTWVDMRGTDSFVLGVGRPLGVVWAEGAAGAAFRGMKARVMIMRAASVPSAPIIARRTILDLPP